MPDPELLKMAEEMRQEAQKLSPAQQAEALEHGLKLIASGSITPPSEEWERDNVVRNLDRMKKQIADAMGVPPRPLIQPLYVTPPVTLKDYLHKP
jgi:hypothetical protein